MKNKLLSMLLALAIAFGLWMYVITVVDPESEGSYYDIPVVFDGISQLDNRNLMITSGTSVAVDLRLLGNRTDLNKLDKTNITILADLSRITEAGEHKVKYSISYPSSAGTIEVLEQDPQYITVHVSNRVHKEVPVNITYTGKLPDSFVADVQHAVLDHTTVTVTGPEEVVERIEYASVEVDLTDRVENIVETCRYTLCDENGQPIEDVSAVTVNVSDIRLTVRVWMIKELPVEIIIKDGGGLTADDVTATPSRDSIMVSGSEAALRGLDKIELLVDLSLLTESKVLEFAIELPEDVTHESGISKVEVDVKVPETTTKVLVIPKDQFVLLNVPEGMSAAPLTEALRVVIRGRENRLEDVTVDNITVYIDFKDAVAGPNYYNCTVEISGVEDVGVVYGENEYRVLAIVSLVFQEVV
jgi:YbbR domain-containing protein